LALPVEVKDAAGSTVCRSRSREFQSWPPGGTMNKDLKSKQIGLKINNFIETFENGLFKQAF
jgi:hypothetical protein